MKYDWVIQLVANGTACEDCGKIEYPYLDGICDAHTHGLKQLYGHQEFQIILQLRPEMICTLLNDMGMRVKYGAKFSGGMFISDLVKNYLVRIDEVKYDGGRLLRLIFPDVNGLWPEDVRCSPLFKLQVLPLTDLKNPDYIPD